MGINASSNHSPQPFTGSRLAFPTLHYAMLATLAGRTVFEQLRGLGEMQVIVLF